MRINATLIFASYATLAAAEEVSLENNTVTDANCICPSEVACVIPPECDIQVQKKSSVRVRKFKGDGSTQDCPSCVHEKPSLSRKLVVNAVPVFKPASGPLYQATSKTVYTPSYKHVHASQSQNAADYQAATTDASAGSSSSQEGEAGTIAREVGETGEAESPVVSVVVNRSAKDGSQSQETAATESTADGILAESEGLKVPYGRNWNVRKGQFGKRQYIEPTSRVTSVVRRPVIYETITKSLEVPIVPRLGFRNRYTIRKAARKAARECFYNGSCVQTPAANTTSV